MNERISVEKDFSHELGEINNKLMQLENGRIYELSHVSGDGTLCTNAKQLRELIVDLLMKIEGKKPTFEEELSKYF